jgi:hypothetical protein
MIVLNFTKKLIAVMALYLASPFQPVITPIARGLDLVRV